MSSMNPFDEPSPAPSDQESPDDARKPPPKEEPEPALESVAGLLLEKRLVLTALELHTELLERGKEVRQLKDYFSNPGNFEQALPQPLLSIKSSDIGEECDNLQA